MPDARQEYRQYAARTAARAAKKGFKGALDGTNGPPTIDEEAAQTGKTLKDGSTTDLRDVTAKERYVYEAETKARDHFMSTVKGNALLHIENLKTAKEMKEKLDSLYGSATLSNDYTVVLRSYNERTYVRGEDPRNFMRDLTNANALLHKIDPKYAHDEAIVKLTIIARLPSEYSNMISKYRGKTLETTSMEDLAEDLHAEFLQLCKEKKYSDKLVLAVAQGKPMKCDKCGMSNHTTEEHRDKPSRRHGGSVNSTTTQNNGSNSMKTRADKRTCFECGKKGHIKPNCLVWKAKQAKKKAEEKNNSGSVSTLFVAAINEPEHTCTSPCLHDDQLFLPESEHHIYEELPAEEEAMLTAEPLTRDGIHDDFFDMFEYGDAVTPSNNDTFGQDFVKQYEEEKTNDVSHPAADPLETVSHGKLLALTR